VQTLNSFFSAADAAAARHGLEKVKTIGDAYLAVAGGMASHDADSRAAVAFARDLVEQLIALEERTGLPLRVRIGIHTGPAVGGVIGATRMAYDYWGDTLNVASRLQGCAPLNGVAVSESTYFQARDVQAFEQRNVILKGIGETACYQARFDARELDD
jgi:adenylate cyclase